MNEPLVSIITPTYNHQRFISECIRSVVAQDYQNWEQIVIDDESTDETFRIASKLSEQDRRVRSFRIPHQGIWNLDAVYNFGLAHARGSLVAIVEGDDCWPSDKLSIQVHEHESQSAFLSYGIVELTGIVSNGRVGLPSFIGTVDSSVFMAEMIRSRAAVHASSLMIDREALENIGGFQQRGHYAVDLPTLLALAKLSGRVLFIDTVLGYWRQYESQTTRVFSSVSDDLGEVVDRLRAVEHSWELRERTLKEFSHIPVTREELARLKNISIAEWCLTTINQYFKAGSTHSSAVRTLAYYMFRHGSVLRKIQAVWALTCNSLPLDYFFPYGAVERIRTSKEGEKN